MNPRQEPPLVVISPHLDDGVISCGRLLAVHPGSVVITAFAGRPPHYDRLTEWDAASGFGSGDDPVRARRAEDRAATRVLGARSVWLEFCDSQYGITPAAETLAAALETAILAQRLTTVYMPLGLFHSDHRLTHDAAVLTMRRHPELTWCAYEDAIYRRYGTLLAERLAALPAEGIATTRVRVSAEDGEAEKRLAVQQYRSQLRALGTPGRPGHEDAFAPERYWQLALCSPQPTG